MAGHKAALVLLQGEVALLMLLGEPSAGWVALPQQIFFVLEY